MPLDPETLQLLGLKSDATEDDVRDKIADLGERAHQAEDLEAKLSAETEARKANSAALAKVVAARDSATAKAKATALSQLEEKGRADGKFAAGDALHTQFNRLAKISLDEAKAFVDSLPAQGQTPLGGPLQTGAAPPASSEAAFGQLLQSDYDIAPAMSGVVEKSLARVGIDAKFLAEFGDVAIEKKRLAGTDDWTAAMRKGA